MEILEMKREQSYKAKVIIFQSRIRSVAAQLKYEIVLKRKYSTILQKFIRADGAKKQLQKLRREDFARKKAAAGVFQKYAIAFQFRILRIRIFLILYNIVSYSVLLILY
jgi:hypothetical protein